MRKVRVILALYPVVHEYAPTYATPPIDGTRKSLQIVAGIDPNDAPISLVIRLCQGVNEGHFGSASRLGNAVAASSLGFQLLVDPRDEQHIPQASLNRRDSRKELASEGVAECAQPQFVNGALLEQGQHTSHLLSVCSGKVKPCKRRFHGSCIAVVEATFALKVSVTAVAGRLFQPTCFAHGVAAFV